MLSHNVLKVVPIVLVASLAAGAIGCDEAPPPIFDSGRVEPEPVWVTPFDAYVGDMWVEPERGDVVVVDSFGVARLDGDGATLFRHGADGVSLSALAFGPDGAAVMLGTCFSPTTFAGVSLCDDVDPQVATQRTLLVELDRQGKVARALPIGETASGALNGHVVALGADGTVHVAGSFNGTVALGDDELRTNATSIFYAQLDDAWRPMVAKSFGATSAAVRALALDPASGDVFMSGTFFGVATFEGENLTSGPSGQAIFLTRLSEDGEPRWAKHYLGSGDYDARFDDDGGVLLYGEGFAPFTSFGGGHVIDGPFATKLDASGEHLWTWRARDESHAASATVDAAGRIVALYTSRVQLSEAVEPAPDCWDEFGFFDESRPDCQYRPAEFVTTRRLQVVRPDGFVLGAMNLGSTNESYGYFGDARLAAGPGASIWVAVTGAEQGVDFGTGRHFAPTVLARLELSVASPAE